MIMELINTLALCAGVGVAYKNYWRRAGACVRSYRKSSGETLAFVEFERLADSVSDD